MSSKHKLSDEKLGEKTELLESEQAKADALFLSIGQGLISTNRSGKIDHINQVALDMLGYKNHELIGQWYPKALMAVDEDNVPIKLTERPITRAFLTGKPVTAKLFYRRKNKSHFPVSLTVSPIMLDGKPIGAVEVFRDYTHDREIERAKDEFIALASHQLRTPLTAIRVYSEMLAMGYAGKLTIAQNQYLDMINISIGRMATLIDSLLSIARIESDTVVLQLQNTKLDKLVTDIIEELRPRMAEKNITLLQNFDDVPEIRTDPVLVKEVYANLLTNAAKYTPKNGTITVTLEVQAGELLSTVQDTGYGIPVSEQKHIFTKFYRASNIASRDTTGTGIGLYLVKRLVEYLGGNIWFESKEKHGSTFCFTLPLSK